MHRRCNFVGRWNRIAEISPLHKLPMIIHSLSKYIYTHTYIYIHTYVNRRRCLHAPSCYVPSMEYSNPTPPWFRHFLVPWQVGRSLSLHVFATYPRYGVIFAIPWVQTISWEMNPLMSQRLLHLSGMSQFLLIIVVTTTRINKIWYNKNYIYDEGMCKWSINKIRQMLIYQCNLLNDYKINNRWYENNWISRTEQI